MLQQLALTSCVQKVRPNYRDMFGDADFGDISIVLDGRTLRAHPQHKRCPVFAVMFSGEWCEKTTRSLAAIGEFGYSTMRAMIEYLYYGDEDGAADSVDLLKAPHMYQLRTI